MKSLLSFLLVVSIATPAMAQPVPRNESQQAAIQIAAAQAGAAKLANATAIRSEILFYDAIIYAIDINQTVNAKLGISNLQPSEIAIPAAFGVLVADYFATKGAWKFLNKVTPQTSTRAWFTTLTTLERQSIRFTKAMERFKTKNDGSPAHRRLMNRLIVREFHAKAAVTAHKASKPTFRMIGRGIRHTGKGAVLLAGVAVFAWATSDAIVLQLPNDGTDLKNSLQNRIVRLETAYESTISEEEINAVILEEEKALDVEPVVSEEAVQADVKLQSEVALDIEAALMQAQEDAAKASETVVEPTPVVVPVIEEPKNLNPEFVGPPEAAVTTTQEEVAPVAVETTKETVKNELITIDFEN
jgi:hypothetical protein